MRLDQVKSIFSKIFIVKCCTLKVPTVKPFSSTGHAQLTVELMDFEDWLKMTELRHQNYVLMFSLETGG